MSVNAKQSISGAVISGGEVRGSVGTGLLEVYSYYTPNVTQPDENTMQVEYVPSSKNMPTLDPVALTLPKGNDGKDGVDGKDGYTPQKGVDYFDGNDGKDGANGKDGIDGKDGANGKDGVDGKDGRTPQNGVDYFTEDDISKITNDVIYAIRCDIAAGIKSAIGGSY